MTEILSSSMDTFFRSQNPNWGGLYFLLLISFNSTPRSLRFINDTVDLMPFSENVEPKNNNLHTPKSENID